MCTRCYETQAPAGTCRFSGYTRAATVVSDFEWLQAWVGGADSMEGRGRGACVVRLQAPAANPCNLSRQVFSASMWQSSGRRCCARPEGLLLGKRSPVPSLDDAGQAPTGCARPRALLLRRRWP